MKNLINDIFDLLKPVEDLLFKNKYQLILKEEELNKVLSKIKHEQLEEIFVKLKYNIIELMVKVKLVNHSLNKWGVKHLNVKFCFSPRSTIHNNNIVIKVKNFRVHTNDNRIISWFLSVYDRITQKIRHQFLRVFFENSKIFKLKNQNTLELTLVPLIEMTQLSLTIETIRFHGVFVVKGKIIFITSSNIILRAILDFFGSKLEILEISEDKEIVPLLFK